MASRGRRDSRSSPTAGTAELLGLLCRTRLPPASRVQLSTHCIERFIERVKPELSVGEAGRLLRQMKGGCHVLRERPNGFGRPEAGELIPNDTVGYVVIPARQGGISIALPIQHRGGGEFVATTCLVASR